MTACAEEFPDGAATIDEFEALLLRVLGRGFPGRVIPGHVRRGFAVLLLLLLLCVCVCVCVCCCVLLCVRLTSSCE